MIQGLWGDSESHFLIRFGYKMPINITTLELPYRQNISIYLKCRLDSCIYKSNGSSNSGTKRKIVIFQVLIKEMLIGVTFNSLTFFLTVLLNWALEIHLHSKD
jgi:hypothetical protein